jgi:hypothetical protein
MTSHRKRENATLASSSAILLNASCFEGLCSIGYLIGWIEKSTDLSKRALLRKECVVRYMSGGTQIRKAAAPPWCPLSMRMYYSSFACIVKVPVVGW